MPIGQVTGSDVSSPQKLPSGHIPNLGSAPEGVAESEEVLQKYPAAQEPSSAALPPCES